MHVEQSRLPSGLQVLTSRLPGFESAAVVCFVKTGSRYETAANGGTAHFLEHLAFKGTSSRSALQIATEIECLGANVNAFTSKEMTAYFVGGLKRTVPESVAILGDVLTDSVFAAEDIAMERNVILQEIKQYQDSPGSLVGNALWDAAYPDQALGRPILGAADFVSRIEREDIAAFVRQHYFAENMIVVGAGDIGHTEFCDLVEKHFSRLPHSAKPDEAEPARYVGGYRFCDPDRFQQVSLLLGLKSVPDADPQSHAHSFLSAAIGAGLSSPLFQEVRQKRGLAYAVQASSDRGSDFGMVTVYAGTTAEHVPELLRVICAELLRATTEIGERDMTRARNQALARLATVTENPFRVARTIVWGLLTRGRVVTPAELIAEVEAVSPEDLKAAAREVVASAPCLSMIGPVPEGDYYGLVQSELGTQIPAA